MPDYSSYQNVLLMPDYSSYPPGTALDSTGHPVMSASGADPVFHGAETKTTGQWGLSSAGPNAVVDGSLATLRGRARSLNRNTANIRGGVNAWTSNLIGTGITPHWQLDNQEQLEELQQGWEYSVPELDHHGVQDIYGVMGQAGEAEYIDGEVLAQFIEMPPMWKNPETGIHLHVPLQVRLLECDHLDAGFTEVMSNGDPVHYGIQWDKRTKKRKGYWITEEHPGEALWMTASTDKRFVPVRDMAHVFCPSRPGQARGITRLAAAITACHELELAIHYELQRKKSQSSLTGAVHTDNKVNMGTAIGGGARVGSTNDAPSREDIEIAPGSFPKLLKDERITFFSSPDVGSNYTDFIKFHDRRVAKGIGLAYEQLTGNLENVSFSSIRFGLVEFRRSCDMWRRRTIIHQFCRPLVFRWLRVGILNGAFPSISIEEYLANPRRFMQIDWRPPKWDSVDPLKDAMTDHLRMRDGVVSRPDVASRIGGRNYREVDKENAAARKNAEDNGLVYDSDPSRVDRSGQAQNFDDAAMKAALEE